MPVLTSGDLTSQRNARVVYASYIINQRELNTKTNVNKQTLLESDIVTKNIGTVFTTIEEQQSILYESPIFTLIISGNKTVSGSTSGLTQINFTGITDGYGTHSPITGILDDAFIPIPMGGMIFNFFGINYSSTINWNSNNALVFGSTFIRNIVSISATTAKAILFGNYDRLCAGLYYSNSITESYSITTLMIIFCDYFTNPGTPTYKYQIRLIKENIGDKRQFIEVSIITSPPSPGYSSAAITYPSDINGITQDSYGLAIDQTKHSPYNITNGATFLNPCGSTFSTSSPAAGTSFIFSSDSTGSSWSFTNNSYVNV